MVAGGHAPPQPESEAGSGQSRTPWAMAIGAGAAVLGAAALATVCAAYFPGHAVELAGAFSVAMAGAIMLFLRRAVSRKQPRLTAAEKTYRAFFDHAIEGIFRTTPEGRYIDANPALAKIYGYESPAALMEALTDIAGQLYVAAGRREQFRDLLRAHDMVTDFVSEIRRRDGSTIWISENARAVRDWTGRLVFYEGTVEDVTARIEADQAIRYALDEAKRANHAKSAFLAAMSHELKTPLNAVLGFSEILKAEMLGSIGQPGYRDYATHIHESGVRLLEIINNILDITRLQAGDVTLERRALAVEEVARAAIAEACAAAATDHEVVLDLPADLPLVDADPARLHQVLAHLLSNALKFTPADGAVSVRACRDGSAGLTLTVADTGIGMAPDKISAALEPFYQIDGSLARRFEGTGLGLAITKALVDLHGGQLTISSRESEGTVVSVRLPAAQAQAAAA